VKYLHRFPILDPRMSTTDLIAEAYALLPDVAPRGYDLSRCEWHRRCGQLLCLCDAVENGEARRRPRIVRPVAEVEEPIRWVRHGLIWKVAA
jgi:hypothetical protein